MNFFVFLEISSNGKLVSSTQVDLEQKVTTFGREKHCDFVLNPPENKLNISRVHASLISESGGWFLYSGSPNEPAKNPLIDQSGKKLEDRTALSYGKVTLFPDDKFKIVLNILEKMPTDPGEDDTQFRETKSQGIDGDLEMVNDSLSKLLASIERVNTEVLDIRGSIKRQDKLNKTQNTVLLIIGIACLLLLSLYVVSQQSAAEMLQKQVAAIVTFLTAIGAIYAIITKESK